MQYQAIQKKRMQISTDLQLSRPSFLMKKPSFLISHVLLDEDKPNTMLISALYKQLKTMHSHFEHLK